MPERRSCIDSLNLGAKMAEVDREVCLLYLLRHGATDNNILEPPRMQGCRSDQGLSQAGREQALLASRWFADRGIAAVYSSPLLRARQTAELIAEPHGLVVQAVEAITEIDVGQWEGLSWAEIERRDPDAYRMFREDASLHPYLGGENYRSARQRAAAALNDLMAANLGRRIVVVAHNGVNRAYLTQLLDMPVRQYRSIPQDNCGINLIRFSGGEAKLITLNAVGHLDR